MAVTVQRQAHRRSDGEPAVGTGKGKAAGLPSNLVLYCARHDYGSFVLSKTGNLKVVMDLLGQTDYRSALNYQHHEVEVARDLLNARHTSRHTAKNDNPVSA